MHASAWQAAVPQGSQTYSENSQCILSGSDSSATGSGTTLTVHFAIGFKTPFAGPKNTYAYTSNASAVSGWQQPAGSSWNIQALAQPPTSLTVQPSSGSGGAGTFTPFAFSGSSVNGFEYLESIQMIFNWTVDGTNGCYIQYYRSANALYLVNNAGTASLGGYAPGTQGAFIENSQCKIDVGATSVTGAFNTLTVHPSILFKTGFPGPQKTFLFMNDQVNGVSGWQQVGTWTGYPASTQPPTDLAASPPSGTGMSQTFVLHTNDVNGYKYIPYQQIVISTTFVDAVNGCSLLYYQGWNVLYLANDANTTWGNAMTLGTPGGTLSNSQCRIDVAGSSWTGTGGNDLYLRVPITFFPAFGGAKYVSMYSVDHAFNSLAWQQVGTWTVQNADFSLSISPSSQTVSPTTSASYAITVNGSNSFNAPVNFNVSGLPAGATFSFNPPSATRGQSTTLTVNVPMSVQAGNYTPIVAGSSGSLSRSAPAVSLNVLTPAQDFSLTVAPNPAAVTAGRAFNYTVTVAAANGFSGSVGFVVSGLPSGATSTLSPSAVTGSGSTTLTISTTSGAALGSSTVTVTGSSAALSHSGTASLSINPIDCSQSFWGDSRIVMVTPNDVYAYAETWSIDPGASYWTNYARGTLKRGTTTINGPQDATTTTGTTHAKVQFPDFDPTLPSGTYVMPSDRREYRAEKIHK